jgi:hypothetical protein
VKGYSQKDHICYVSIDMKCPKHAIPHTESRLVAAGEVWGSGEELLVDMRFLF